ncbi:MAG: PTS mannose/fructose/sorbose transporter subunit IIB [Deltaproteobacteria bacterium HGW-Deltaproteobacteria-19]|jgi:PTS system mannose-specific IIB component|nr:MAG: PTS mannose/fructose/sorbose transporter subunit IIB [Deltaproteobacteria bacterium HGW-Deltaproteobacteria-19]
MDIVLVRIDNRLVHGQIIEAWVPFARANCIIVVDDHVASDFFRETVIKMSVPRDIETLISSVDEFPAIMKSIERKGRKAIILFSSMKDALRAYRGGFHFDHLNIGNIHNEECIHQCAPSVLLGEEDVAAIRELVTDGVHVDVRRVPREKPVDIRDVLGDETR